MSDLQKYISKRKEQDQAFCEGFDEGYQSVKVGALLRQAREESGLSQEDVAIRLHTRKAAIARIENHAENITLATLERLALSLGKTLEVSIR